MGWRPWILDGNKCAYKMAPQSDSRWRATYKVKPKYEERQVAQGKKIALLELPPGEYFIAHWKQGFFTKSTTDKKKYTGFYLKVE
jgi:hypothetical protein